MKNSVLYYPYTTLPNSSWIKQALLFNDKIGMILPRNVPRNIVLNKASQELHSLGVLNQFIPDKYLDFTFFEKFVENLEIYLTKRLDKNPVYHNNFVIYEGKMQYFLINMLEKKGLVSRKDNYTYWIDKEIGEAYLTAVSHAIVSKDEFKHFSLFSDKVSETNTMTKLLGHNPAFYKTLSATLPIPKKAKFEEIIKFKNKNEKYLNRYLQMVKNEIRDISSQAGIESSELNYSIQKIKSLGDDLYEQAYSFFGKESIKFTAISVIPIGLALAPGANVDSRVSTIVNASLLIKELVDTNRKIKNSDFYYLAHSIKKFR